MLYQKKMHLGRTFALCSATLSLSLFTALQCQGSPSSLTLTDGNSVVIIDPTSQQGMNNWSVNGINQLSQQWFWYRVGSAGPEQSIDTIGVANVSYSPSVPNVGTVTYTSSGQFSVATTYTLTGGTPITSGASDIGESIRINNLSGAPLDFHFFQYSDFSLGGTPGDDKTVLSTSFLGLFNQALVWDSALAATMNVDTVSSPGANHGEVAAVGLTLAKLNDANPDVLSDVAGPLGPSHNTWALEWDLTIGTGGSALISLDKNLQSALVPEPSSLALISLGLVGYVLRRRGQAA
jgi:hypothetical protein